MDPDLQQTGRVESAVLPAAMQKVFQVTNISKIC
jgi:hypothetical protein